MSPVSGLYFERAEEISSSLAAGNESPLREKAHASGYKYHGAGKRDHPPPLFTPSQLTVTAYSKRSLTCQHSNTYLSRFPKIPNFRTLENHVTIKLGSWNFAKLVYHCWTDGKKKFKLIWHREGGFLLLEPPFSVKLSCDDHIYISTSVRFFA
jgi:hypothetical protein